MARARGQTALALGDRSTNPARSRGLKRASATRAPCPPPDRTPLYERATDDDGEERRTELVLRPVPELMPDELAAAAARLTHWENDRGPLLNTGSQTGIVDAPVLAAPLAPAERRHRAITRAKRRREARHLTSKHNCAPPFGAGPPAQHGSSTAHLAEDDNACVPRSRVTRPRPRESFQANAAPKRSETASLTMGGEVSGSESVIDVVAGAAAQREAAYLERVAVAVERATALQAERAALYELVAAHASRRTDEVKTWTSTRGWALGRLREA